jgi:hypothetical protein
MELNVNPSHCFHSLPTVRPGDRSKGLELERPGLDFDSTPGLHDFDYQADSCMTPTCKMGTI